MENRDRKGSPEISGNIRPFRAFSANGRFASVCYAHRDSCDVYDILEKLYLDGYNIWYDEGRARSDVTEMEERMADRDCELFIMFISPASVRPDSWPMKRLELVRKLEKRIVFVSPDCFGMPDGMELFFQGSRMITGNNDEAANGLRTALPEVCRSSLHREPDSFSLDEGLFTEEEKKEADPFEDPSAVPEPELPPEEPSRRLPIDEDDRFEYMLSGDSGLSIAKYTGSDEKLEIEDTRDGYPITRIGDQAFRGCERLTRVRLPGSLTYIGHTAFRECSALTDIIIPQGVTALGTGAFYGCRSLTKVVVPSSVTAIGDLAFCGCRGMTRITIPDSVTTIGDGAFRDCMLLIIECMENTYPHWYATRNNIPFRLISQDSMKERLSASLNGAAGTSGTVGAPNKRSSQSGIEPSLSGTAYAAQLDIPAPSRRQDEKRIYSPVIEPKGDSYAYLCFDDGDFRELRAIITDLAREGCDLCRCPDPSFGDVPFRSVEDGIKDCGLFVLFLSRNAVQSGRVMDAELDRALRYVRDRIMIVRLDEANIPDTLPQVGGDNIIDRRQLTDEQFKRELLAHINAAGCGAKKERPRETVQYSAGDFEFIVNNSGAVLTCYHGKEEKLEIPSRLGGYGVAGLGDRLFENNEVLVDVSIPASVAVMGIEIFKGCGKLERVVLPPSVTKIGYGTFRDCRRLTEVNLPSTVTEIGLHAFEGCRSLKAFAIPAKVEIIESWTFDGCVSLGRISIPDNVKKIDENAFFNCPKRMVILSKKDSFAQKFAKANGYRWKRVK